MRWIIALTGRLIEDSSTPDIRGPDSTPHSTCQAPASLVGNRRADRRTLSFWALPGRTLSLEGIEFSANGTWLTKCRCRLAAVTPLKQARGVQEAFSDRRQSRTRQTG
jgi:hypothetical protein